MKSRVSVVLAVMLFLVAACTSGGGAASPSATPSVAAADLTIFGAASLAKVLDDVKLAYEASVPGSTVTISTDSSAALATQIQEGAPADVFLSADTTNPQKLVDGGFVDGEAVNFAGNKLVVITPTNNPGGLTTPFDLAKDGVDVVAAGDEVPITKYATQLVDNLAKEPGAPADFAAAVAANVVSKEDNVAAVRTKIELGEGDAAIVYVTDAKASTDVVSIDVPDSANVPATYAGAVVKASANTEAAHAFLDWLAGPDGQAVLAGYGFQPPAS